MTEIGWEDILQRLEAFTAVLGSADVVYGVPRNGMLLCAHLPWSVRVTHDPALATVILDDLVDSGATRERYRREYPQARFVALYEKRQGDAWYRFPWEHESGPEDAVVRLLEYVGEDPRRDGLLRTPQRVVKALAEMTAGAKERPEDYLRTVFASDADQMIVVRDIPFSSLCEHHLLPFHGSVTLGYLPSGKVFGLSKIPRLVHGYARRLQLQEQFTQQIARAVMDSPAQPDGVGVVVRAVHTCMTARGVRSAGEMRTSALLGSMRDGAREEFLRLAGER